MTLTERKSALLAYAMDLSKERQALANRLSDVDRDMFKTAGAMDLLDTLIAEHAEPTVNSEASDGK